MRELSLHLLDIAENSVAAQASAIRIHVCEDLPDDRLLLSISDDGRGMDPATVARIVDPFVTSRTNRKVGLGIPLLKAAAEGCNGWLHIQSKPGEGTCLEVEFQRSHIDRMPLGDLPATFLSLIVAHPEIHWQLEYHAILGYGSPTASFSFDDQPVKEILGEIPLCDPHVLSYLRETLGEGISEIQSKIRVNEGA